MFSHFKFFHWQHNTLSQALCHPQGASWSFLVYNLWGLSLMVQRLKITSSGCVHDVWAHPIMWHSLGPEPCGLLGAAFLRSRIEPPLNSPWHLFMIAVAAFEAFDSKGLHWLSLHDFNSRSTHPSLSLWSCLDEFTIWFTIWSCAIMLSILATHPVSCAIKFSVC